MAELIFLETQLQKSIYKNACNAIQDKLLNDLKKAIKNLDRKKILEIYNEAEKSISDYTDEKYDKAWNKAVDKGNDILYGAS